MYKFQPKKIPFCRLDVAGGERKHVNVSNIAKQTCVPVTMLWKRVNDKVRGMDHHSGGPRQPKVLTKGRSNLFFFTCFHFPLKIKVSN